jgi:glycine cleavage system regulatory protein
LLNLVSCDTKTLIHSETTMKYAVMTTVSRDREGLVAKYTDFLRERGANLYGGYGQQLGRMFVFDVLFQDEDEAMARVAAEMPEQLAGSAPTFVPVSGPVVYRNPNAQHYVLHHISEDSTGIVSKLSEVVTAHGASIVNLTSHTFSAADSGVTLFEARMNLDVPNSGAVRHLREELRELQRHKGWDLELEPELRAGLEVASTAPYPPSAGVKPVTQAAPQGTTSGSGEEAPKWAVLSTMSPDRPGIVASASRFLGQRRASIHSQAARRIGELFCAHYLFKASAADMERVKAEFSRELADFTPTLTDAVSPALPGDELRLELTVHAMDEPGILAGLSKAITMYGASIASVSFGLYPAAESPRGVPLFVVEMSLLVRDYIASRHIEAALLALELEHGWEVDYRPARKSPEAPGSTSG